MLWVSACGLLAMPAADAADNPEVADLALQVAVVCEGGRPRTHAITVKPGTRISSAEALREQVVSSLGAGPCALSEDGAATVAQIANDALGRLQGNVYGALLLRRHREVYGAAEKPAPLIGEAMCQLVADRSGNQNAESLPRQMKNAQSQLKRLQLDWHKLSRSDRESVNNGLYAVNAALVACGSRPPPYDKGDVGIDIVGIGKLLLDFHTLVMAALGNALAPPPQQLDELVEVGTLKQLIPSRCRSKVREIAVSVEPGLLIESKERGEKLLHDAVKREGCATTDLGHDVIWKVIDMALVDFHGSLHGTVFFGILMQRFFQSGRLLPRLYATATCRALVERSAPRVLAHIDETLKLGEQVLVMTKGRWNQMAAPDRQAVNGKLHVLAARVVRCASNIKAATAARVADDAVQIGRAAGDANAALIAALESLAKAKR